MRSANRDGHNRGSVTPLSGGPPTPSGPGTGQVATAGSPLLRPGDTQHRPRTSKRRGLPARRFRNPRPLTCAGWVGAAAIVRAWASSDAGGGEQPATSARPIVALRAAVSSAHRAPPSATAGVKGGRPHPQEAAGRPDHRPSARGGESPRRHRRRGEARRPPLPWKAAAEEPDEKR